MSTQLFAAIREDSKYFNQNPRSLPFPVRIVDTTDSYRVKGNDNQYRLEDVNLYVRAGGHWRSVNGGPLA